MKTCSSCSTSLPDTAKFCLNCGAPQNIIAVESTNQSIEIDLAGDVPQQIIDLFFVALEQRVSQEHKANQYSQYYELLYQTGFRDTVQLRADQLAEEIRTKDPIATHQLLERSFEGLLDYFIIHFGKELNHIHLPDAILKYEGRSLSEVDLYTLSMDYLDFEREEEQLFTNFVEMPVKKLKNASKSFLFAEQNERVFFICDQSIFGSCKEGFAMTQEALYWKAQLQQPERVYYHNIHEVKREKNWIMINGCFFNVNPSINVKMMKLLKRLKYLHED